MTGHAALGYWPAFWALGSPFRGNYWNWPGIGELDFMENVNGLDWTFGTLHCGVAPGGPCNEYNGIAGQTYCGGSCHNGFHAYGFEWDDSGTAGQLRWYVDGTLYHTIDEGDLPADTWAQMTEHAGYFLMLNLAIGGAFPDGVSGQTTPTAATVPGHSMLVDYVRVSTAPGGGSGEPTVGAAHDRPAAVARRLRDVEADLVRRRLGRDRRSGVDRPARQRRLGPLRRCRLRFDQSPGLRGPGGLGGRGGVSGLVEVRIDSATANPIGSFALANTGGWTSWRDVPGNVTSVTGVHDVYLTFTSGQSQDFVSVEEFHFRH